MSSKVIFLSVLDLSKRVVATMETCGTLVSAVDDFSLCPLFDPLQKYSLHLGQHVLYQGLYLMISLPVSSCHIHLACAIAELRPQRWVGLP